MSLNRLLLKDKQIISQYLKIDRHELSTYTFENIYIWKDFFDIEWAIIEGSLCVFFRDDTGCFLYLPPLGETKSKKALAQAFRIMNKFNQNKDISRIENIEAKDAAFYKQLGFDLSLKSYDYLCLRDNLSRLSGDRFKAKRSNCNYFIKHYEFEYLPFSPEFRDECLQLYSNWTKERKTKYKNYIYQGMLEDSLTSLKIALNSFSYLNLIGRIIRLDKDIKAFTFGFKLNRDTFCILYEISDLSVKGLAQFIFFRFCNELKNYKYINIMDDLGLENLRPVKLSYRPIRLIPSYIAKHKTGPSSLPIGRRHRCQS